VAELEALVLALGEALLVVTLVVIVTTVVPELVLLALFMLMVMIDAVVVLYVQPLTPALVGKMLQLAFVVHALWQLMPLR
jgi:hypothetical protein